MTTTTNPLRTLAQSLAAGMLIGHLVASTRLSPCDALRVKFAVSDAAAARHEERRLLEGLDTDARPARKLAAFVRCDVVRVAWSLVRTDAQRERYGWEA